MTPGWHDSMPRLPTYSPATAPVRCLVNKFGGLWRLLEAPGGFWRLLEASGGFWRLLWAVEGCTPAVETASKGALRPAGRQAGGRLEAGWRQAGVLVPVLVLVSKS